MADDEINGIEKSSTPNSFDLQLIYDSFTKCANNINALEMDSYLTGFKELQKFFGLLGSVFSFVSSDITSKVSILEAYRQSENAEKYKTIQSMIEFECSNGITSDTSKPSGCRTLLRLNWALEFIMAFMKELSMADCDAKSSHIARKCYKESLSKHHSWWIQQGANIAMYTLPVRQQFMERVFGGPCNQESVHRYEKIMNDIADVSKILFDETQKLYTQNNIIDLA